MSDLRRKGLLFKISVWAARSILRPFAYSVVPKEDSVDFFLFEYKNYEHYRRTQIIHNKRKLSNIWADENTLDIVIDILRDKFDSGLIKGLCHGSRNGFEQDYLRKAGGIQAVGTDISETALSFDNTVHWDFHDVNPDWVNAIDFVYSNSLDQSWRPVEALEVWLAQVHKGGVVIIEHTKEHGPGAAGEMDPFGVKPRVLPYVLVGWFGDQISISYFLGKKKSGLDFWLFVISKNYEKVAALSGGNKLVI